MGYFEQTNVSSLVDSNTVLEEIATGDTGQEPRLTRLIAGAMLFEGDDALKPVRVLSGGEKSRVMLGKLIATPLNLLLLDEPTNHLDLESSDALLSALDNFEGAVVMVTHNERFLEALAERLIVFQDDGILVYEGDYDRFLKRVGWKDEDDRKGKKRPDEKSEEAVREAVNPRESRKIRSELISERSKALRPIEKAIAEKEKQVEKLDAELQKMNQAVVEASRRKDGFRVVELSKSMHGLKRDIDLLLDEMEKLTNDLEKKKAGFEERLSGLDAGSDAS